jgi:ectoine hydroxylase-related dioxygenase (phytanoyl-CoA dioxygenase family)
MALTEQQIQMFQHNGCLVIPSVFDEDEVWQMRREADHILSLIINSSLCNERHSGRLDIRRSADGSAIVRKIQPIIDLSLDLAKFSLDDRLLGPMSELMQDEPVLMEEKLNYKQPIKNFDLFKLPADDDRFPIHNDFAYYQMNGYPTSIISSALCMDDLRIDNGTLIVFPGTHLSHLPHEQVRNGLEVVPGYINPAEAIPIVVPAGSVMFFHSQLVHTSGPNTSGKPRRVMIYSHYPKSADMGIDVRNAPGRLRESPWEWEYQRKKSEGEFSDQFVVEEPATVP